MSEATLSENFEDLYETAPCGYVSLSADGKIVKANRTLLDWLERKPDEVIGRPVHDLLSFGGRIAVETHLAPLLRIQGQVHEIALDLLAANGEKIPTITNAAEKRDANGRHLFTRLTLFKAVDRRTYERSLLEAQVKAEAESRAQREAAVIREQFIAVLGHDLRNPLGAVAAGIRLLQTAGRQDQADAILADMGQSVERASALIDDVLDLTRGTLGGGLVVDRNGDAELTPVLQQVVNEIRLIAPDHSIETRMAIDEPVYCDRDRLGQLASNLLANAVTHGAADRPIRLDAHTAGGEFILSVANTGEPIPQEVRASLFQPFFRGQVRPSGNGLGLGLFIASEIAKAHDGTLDFASDEHETRFTLRMPRGPKP